MVVGDDLVHDPVRGLGRGVGVAHRADVDRDGRHSGLDGGQGSPLPVVDLGDAVWSAECGDPLQHSVFSYAGHEVRVQRRLVADVGVDLQIAGAQVLEGALGVGAGVGCRAVSRCGGCRMKGVSVMVNLPRMWWAGEPPAVRTFLAADESGPKRSRRSARVPDEKFSQAARGRLGERFRAEGRREKVLKTVVAPKGRSWWIRLPKARCQAMNTDEDRTAKIRPSGSSVICSASPAMTSASS